MSKITQSLTLFILSLFPSVTLAASTGLIDSKCTGSTYTKGLLKGLPCNEPADDLKYIAILIKNILTLTLSVVGVIFIIMFFVAGFLYITTGIRFGGGRESQIKLAKQIFKFAVIGLLVVLFARVAIEAVATMLGGGIG